MAATVDVTRTESMQIEEEYAALNKRLHSCGKNTPTTPEIRKPSFPLLELTNYKSSSLRYQNQKAGMPNASVAASSSTVALHIAQN
ncbi:hypothetical protein H4Q26_012057 [Puccinia striiformis f. sp. tritici PST-130]|nr:hypothetical protein H4Q26_012057 [Puccinia striiformis f. sp. tritici PST-130]